jgi:16S rRNA (guanine527-N7)-methyltransferase
MVKGRYIPSKESTPREKEKEETTSLVKDANAMWRISQWFPSLAEETVARLKAYQVELLKFNIKLNLISRNTERECDELHFADCIFASQILFNQALGNRVFDIGSGNGFPGIVLALLDPKREFVLVESDARKCEFLKHSIHSLGVKNATVMNVRFESLVGVGVEVAVSRGFASISKTILVCNRVFTKGGLFFHLKGTNWSSEIAELPSQLISVWMPQLVGEYTLPGTQARRAVVATQKSV